MAQFTYRFDGGVIKGKRIKKQKKEPIKNSGPFNSIPANWSIVMSAKNQVRVTQASASACKSFWLEATELSPSFMEDQLEKVHFAVKGVPAAYNEGGIFLAIVKPEAINIFLGRVYEFLKAILPPLVNAEILLFGQGDESRDKFLAEAVSYWQKLLKDGAPFDSNENRQHGIHNYDFYDHN
jgi:hypothetical protein